MVYEPPMTTVLPRPLLFVAEYVTSYTETAQTVHHAHTPIIEIVSDGEARGIWAMEDIVDRGSEMIHGFGHYHEKYRRVDGKWRFAAVRLTRLRISKTVRDSVTA